MTSSSDTPRVPLGGQTQLVNFLFFITSIRQNETYYTLKGIIVCFGRGYLIVGRLKVSTIYRLGGVLRYSRVSEANILKSGNPTKSNTRSYTQKRQLDEEPDVIYQVP